jgi:hypothetical protein
VTIAPVGSPDGTMVMPAVVAAGAVAAAPVDASPGADLIDPSPLPPVPPPPARTLPSVPWPLVLGVAAAALLLFFLVGALGNGDDAPTRPVPDVLSSSVADATTYLEGAGLQVDVVEAESDVPAGTVIASEPAEGESIATGGVVELVVSSGPAEAPATTVPPPPPSDDGDGGAGDGDGGRDKPGKGNKDN